MPPRLPATSAERTRMRRSSPLGHTGQGFANRYLPGAWPDCGRLMAGAIVQERGRLAKSVFSTRVLADSTYNTPSLPPNHQGAATMRLLLTLALLAAAADSPRGKMETVAGTGKAGHAGDGGKATAALLKQPFHCDLDAAGNLYIAEAENHCIR